MQQVNENVMAQSIQGGNGSLIQPSLEETIAMFEKNGEQLRESLELSTAFIEFKDTPLYDTIINEWLFTSEIARLSFALAPSCNDDPLRNSLMEQLVGISNIKEKFDYLVQMEDILKSKIAENDNALVKLRVRETLDNEDTEDNTAEEEQ